MRSELERVFSHESAAKSLEEIKQYENYVLLSKYLWQHSMCVHCLCRIVYSRTIPLSLQHNRRLYEKTRHRVRKDSCTHSQVVM